MCRVNQRRLGLLLMLVSFSGLIDCFITFKIHRFEGLRNGWNWARDVLCRSDAILLPKSFWGEEEERVHRWIVPRFPTAWTSSITSSNHLRSFRGIISTFHGDSLRILWRLFWDYWGILFKAHVGPFFLKTFFELWYISLGRCTKSNESFWQLIRRFVPHLIWHLTVIERIWMIVWLGLFIVCWWLFGLDGVEDRIGWWMMDFNWCVRRNGTWRRVRRMCWKNWPWKPTVASWKTSRVSQTSNMAATGMRKAEAWPATGRSWSTIRTWAMCRFWRKIRESTPISWCWPSDVPPSLLIQPKVAIYSFHYSNELSWTRSWNK